VTERSERSDGRRHRWGDPQRRAIEAARQLAEEGGYDAVQIRDIVARTGLSSATIYRHFSSKDHLIAAAQLEWNRTLLRARRELAVGATAADRVAALLHQACVAFGQSPNLARSLVLAYSSAPDPGVRAVQSEANQLVMATLRDVIGDELADPDVVLDPLMYTYFGALVAWSRGQLTIEDVDRLLQHTTRLLFAGAQAAQTSQTTPATPAAQATIAQ
jgi:AcrR family transcriptional regulator